MLSVLFVIVVLVLKLLVVIWIPVGLYSLATKKESYTVVMQEGKFKLKEGV